jgi:hypothetical protein
MSAVSFVLVSRAAGARVDLKGLDQKGGSSSLPPKEPDAGALPQGSSVGGVAGGREPPPPPPPPPPPKPPPPPPPPREALFTFAGA